MSRYSLILTNPVIARFMRATHFSYTRREKWVAWTSRAMTGLFLVLVLGVAACGVKSDLVTPDGKPTPKGQKDPSKPPAQQQQQGL